jgi:hypothetical protein
VRALVERARTGDPALVWVRYRALGEALAAAGVPYYGRETHPGAVAGARSIAVSIGAHATGSNLQAWARAIVAHPPSSAEVWEQLISREARTGQRADVVSHEILVHTDKQHERIDRARARARAIAAKSKLPQKLAYGTWKGNAQ